MSITLEDRAEYTIRVFGLGIVGGRLGEEFAVAWSGTAFSVEGDTNGDDVVNIDDLNNVRNNFGTIGPNDGTLDGDAFPFDGMVNIDDFNGVRNNFGTDARAVPEPSTLALTSLLALACIITRGSRR